MFDIEPVEFKDFYRVHDPYYVDGILAGSISNGFGTSQTETALSFFLPVDPSLVLPAGL